MSGKIMDFRFKLSYFYFVLWSLLLFFLLCTGCTGNIKNEKCKEIKKIEGVLKIYENKQFVIISNPESKSRVSYNIININLIERIKLKKYENLYIVAEVCVLKKHSPWNIDVMLIKINGYR